MKRSVVIALAGISAGFLAPIGAEAAIWRVYLPPFVPAPEFSLQTWELVATFDDKGEKVDGSPLDPCDSESLEIGSNYKSAGDYDKVRRALEIACVNSETGQIERISND